MRETTTQWEKRSIVDNTSNFEEEKTWQSLEIYDHPNDKKYMLTPDPYIVRVS